MSDMDCSPTQTEKWRSLACEIADVLVPPDFVSDPNRNEWAIDMAEQIIIRHMEAADDRCRTCGPPYGFCPLPAGHSRSEVLP